MPGRTFPALALEQAYGHAAFCYDQAFGRRKLYRTSIPMAMSGRCINKEKAESILTIGRAGW